MSQYYYQIRVQQGDVAFEVEATSPDFAAAQLNKLAVEVLGITPVSVSPVPSIAHSPTPTPIVSAPPQIEQIIAEPDLVATQPQVEVPKLPEAVEVVPVALAEDMLIQDVAEVAPLQVDSEPQPEPENEEDSQFEAFMDTLLSDLDNPESDIKLPFEEVSQPPASLMPSSEELNDTNTTTTDLPAGPQKLSGLSLDALKEKKVASFESVFTEAQLELDVSQSMPPSASAEKFAATPVFENALSSSIDSLQELCEGAPGATKAEEFLLLTAYYLKQYKSSSTFSLKVLNTELLRAGLTPINHAILETVVMHQLLNMVPDLTGEAQSAEYELTQGGLDAVMEMLK